MVVKKKNNKKGKNKEVKKSDKSKKDKKVAKKLVEDEESEEEESEGLSLDDAFGDDEDVEYGESKPFKAKKKEDDEEGMSEGEMEVELEGVEERLNGAKDDTPVTIKASKPISKVKKGDIIKIDGVEYEVDAHTVMMDHKSTKEMAIDIFDKKKDKDFQLRYFDDQVESTIEFYELQEIMYFKKQMYKIEW